MHPPSPEAAPSLSGAGRPAYAKLKGTASGGGCGAGAGTVTGGHPWQRASWGAAASGRVQAAAARQDRTASACSNVAKRRWAMFSTASTKRPVWDTGTLRNQTLSVSLCQPDIARGMSTLTLSLTIEHR